MAEGNIRIRALNSTEFSAFETLFQTDKQCADCWCLNHRVLPSACQTGDTARLAMKALVENGQASGLLAFSGNECIGWCGVDPLSTQVGHDYVLAGEPVSSNDWTIHCLYIHPRYRGQGISGHLIEAAVEFALSNGAARIFAFPIPEENRKKFPPGEAEFSGRYSTYAKKGFRLVKGMNEFYSIVELIL